MADNITLPGTGAVVGTETVGGAQVQQVKVLWGAVDTGTEIAAATPLPVVQTGTPALPTGAATSAAQTTGNSSLSSIDGKTPALGQALAAASVPVVLTAAQLATLAQSAPPTSGGLSIYRNISLLATGQSVKGSAGQLFGYFLANQAASTRYVKFYNKATAPTVGTDTPVLTLTLPAGASANVSLPYGIAFALGIGVGATTGVADNDTGIPSANDVVINLFYA